MDAGALERSMNAHAPESKRISMVDLTSEVAALWDEINAAIHRVLRRGQFVLGPEVGALETEIADYIGAQHAIAVNSGTDALVIALRALGIGRGDEVITTAFTFFATTEAILAVGATPVHVDIDLDTFNIDPDGVQAAIGPRTRAIIPVHLYGRPAGMRALRDVAEANRLHIIEDAAQAFGAVYWDGDADAGTNSRLSGRRVGALGDVAAFSFYPTKNLAAYGDGGMVTTNDDDIATLCRQLRNHGETAKYVHSRVGLNSRLDEIQAAILRVKLGHVEAWNARRRELAALYTSRLLQLDNLVVPQVTPGHVFHQYTVRVRVDRAKVQGALASLGIPTAVHYPYAQTSALHDLLEPVGASHEVKCRNADAAAQTVLSLPIHPWLSDAVAAEVAEGMANALATLDVA